MLVMLCRCIIGIRTTAGLKRVGAKLEELCRRRSLKIWVISEHVPGRKGRSTVVYSLGVASTLPPPLPPGVADVPMVTAVPASVVPTAVVDAVPMAMPMVEA